MSSSGLWLFGIFNVILLVLTFGLLVGFFYLSCRRKDVFSHLADSLETLGFTKRGWTRQPSLLPFGETGGYYSATIDGRSFEVHFYADGGRRFKFTPYIEFVLLGYFNASLFISTPQWRLPSLRWLMPQKLNLLGYEGFEIGTTDEASARALLGDGNIQRIVRRMLISGDGAILTIGARDIHFTIKLGDLGDIQPSELQTWLQGMAQLAVVISTLPPLAPDLVYEDYSRGQAPQFDTKRLILLVLFLLLLMPLIIIALFVLR